MSGCTKKENEQFARDCMCPQCRAISAFTPTPMTPAEAREHYDAIHGTPPHRRK